MTTTATPVPRTARAIGYRERAEFYAHEHADTVDQPFLAGLAWAADGPVLEVPCGSGRNLALLASTGRQVTGMDLEPEMAGAARRAVGATPGIQVVVGDMRSLTLTERPALILVPREAFQLLPTYADAVRTLRRFRDQLRPGGTVMLDLATFAVGAQDEQHLHPSYFDPRLHDGHLVLDWVRETADGQLERWHRQQQESDAVTIGYRYEVRRAGGPVEASEAAIRLLRSPRERVFALLAESGLRARTLLGDYTGRRYREGSPRLIVLATGAEA
jgi:SAM-dependent methyltransferase